MEKELRDLFDTLKKLGFPKVLSDNFSKLVESGASTEPTELLGKLREFDLSKELTEFVGIMVKQRAQNELKEVLDKTLKLALPEELRGVLNRIMEGSTTFDWQGFYEKLRKVGFLTEFKLNEQIHNNLNRKEIVESLNQFSFVYADLLQDLNEFVELISGPLNLPTKNDVANVAKLAIQHEEKLNEIEEQLSSLNQFLREKFSEDVQPVTAVNPVTSEKTQPVKVAPKVFEDVSTVKESPKTVAAKTVKESTKSRATKPTLDASEKQKRRILLQSMLQPSNDLLGPENLDDLLSRNQQLSISDLLGSQVPFGRKE
ncbi:hypothetical protein [Robertmurraya kyonggiensis]|uniref:Uncharacterized protein n=1 Tax=Robertmurraya kyonggiensis TaxID=1037680 RepID=A0A4U1DBB5_9BACI|nr:hypothetical protein [Robertmurraya kyonggiensis]TKC18766.1 hypothetical protein FA727_04200 [Robertmurraya kyonggiensis]